MQQDLIITTAAALDTSGATDVSGFESFYRDRYAPMVRLATLLVDRVEVAEELVQEAFAKVYLRWSSLDAPVGYLRAAVVNRARDAQRWRRRRQPLAVVDAATTVFGEPVDHVRNAIRALPARQRAAIVLRFYEDLTVDEIASALGARPGTVKSLLHRGLSALRKEIGDDR